MHPALTAQVAAERRAKLLREAESARLVAAARPGATGELRVRALDPSDRGHVAALFERLSPRSRYLRYLAPVRSLPEKHLSYLAAIDHQRHEAVGAFETGALVGAAHYFRSADAPSEAEISVEVADSHQRLGLGRRLLLELGRLARSRGITVFTATSLKDNGGVRGLLEHSQWPSVVRYAGHELSIALTLPDLAEPPAAVVGPL